MQAITIDRFDLALLEAVQQDGQATNTVLGEIVRFVASPVGRRLQRPGESGIITGQVSWLNAADLPAVFDLMMKRMLRLPGVARVRTHIALQTIKQRHVLQLDHRTQPSRSRRRVRYAGDDGC